MNAALPPGYVQVGGGDGYGAALENAAAAIERLLDRGPLYRVAAGHPERRMLAGRLPAFVIPVESQGRIVVRHNTHGGVLATLTGDRFIRPTRAPRELRVAVRLAAAGVPTPEIVAYLVYPDLPFLSTADVATRFIEDAVDLPTVLCDARPERRQAALRMTAELLRGLAACGARHPDLNLKNILVPLSDTGAGHAWVLDVDRVVFGDAGAAAAEANHRRLARSARKWAARHGLRFGEDELGLLRNSGRS